MRLFKRINRYFLRFTAKIIARILKIFTTSHDLLEIAGDELAELPQVCIHALRKNTHPGHTNFLTLNKNELPDEICNFEDLTWLFNCNYSNRGIIAQDFDEAAYIFKTVRNRGHSINNLLEVGRFLGGSTFLIASAKPKQAHFISVDLKVKAPKFADDAVIRQFVDLVDNKNTQLVISDSRSYEPQSLLDFIFIDGDHSYEGVKADYYHYEKYLNKNADVLFHDAVASRKYCTKDHEVYRFMEELKNSQVLKFVKDVGSIRHYRYLSS